MNAIHRRQWLTTAAACGLGLPLGALAQADNTVRLIVTFPPGGSTDITARILQPVLSARIGRPVVVENKPGAASQVGTQFVAKAAPDGNTLLVCFDSHAINPIAKPNLPYDTFKDFAGVTLAVRFPLVIAASASVKSTDLRGFLEEARQQPGKFSELAAVIGGEYQGMGHHNHYRFRQSVPATAFAGVSAVRCRCLQDQAAGSSWGDQKRRLRR